MTETSDSSFSFMGTDFSKFMEAGKRMAGTKPFHADVGRLMDIQCKNLEAMAAIGKDIIDAMQAFMRGQAEFVSKGFEEMEALEKAMSSGSQEEKTMRQAQATKCLWDKAMENMQEGMDSMAKCNANAMEMMTQCLEDNLNEWRGTSKSDGSAKETKQSKKEPKDSA